MIALLLMATPNLRVVFLLFDSYPERYVKALDKEMVVA